MSNDIQRIKLTGGSTTARIVFLVLVPFTCGLSIIPWVAYEIIHKVSK